MRKKPWLYSAPAILLILIVVVFPIGYTAYISLTNMNLYHWADFRVIGLSNYVRALFKFDSGFLGALFTTLLWTVVNMALQLICGFWIALGLNAKGLRLRRLYKTLLMLPWAMPAYVSILLWRVGIFNTEFGLLNQWLTALGLPKYSILDNTVTAFLACLALQHVFGSSGRLEVWDILLRSTEFRAGHGGGFCLQVDCGRLPRPAQGIQNKLFFSQRHSLLLELLPPWRPR